MTAGDFPKILTKFEGISNGRSLESYRNHEGYLALENILKTQMPQDEIIANIKASGLRGRGGAGFSAGLKWGFVKRGSPEVYLICNFDEGEPGTFKDRYIAQLSPHMLLEGMLIAAYAIGSQRSYIYIRGEFFDEIRWIEEAIAEAYQGGWLGQHIAGTSFCHNMSLFSGAGAYICGEETGLIHSLEGGKGQPFLKPPFPAEKGFRGAPTVVNNVETLANVPWIILNGAQSYRAIGTEKSPGTKLFCVSGPVIRPGVYERPLGYPLQKLIDEDCGGMLPGKALKAVIPGGLSAPVLTKNEVKLTTLDYECLATQGSMLGAGAVIVIPEETSMVDLLEETMHFFAHESCGQCTPCREGTGWLHRIAKKIRSGGGCMADLQRIEDIATNMAGKTICTFSEAAALPAIAIVRKFADEFSAHLKAPDNAVFRGRQA